MINASHTICIARRQEISQERMYSACLIETHSDIEYISGLGGTREHPYPRCTLHSLLCVMGKYWKHGLGERPPPHHHYTHTLFRKRNALYIFSVIINRRVLPMLFCVFASSACQRTEHSPPNTTSPENHAHDC